MAKKEFTYRGHTPEQLKKMSVKEFATLLPSRERRTILRGLTEPEKSLLRKVDKRDNIKTHAREMVVLPMMIGKTILVHNGKEYVPVAVTEEMVGYRFGEFAHTRKPIKHSSPGIGASSSSKSGPAVK